MTMQPSWSSPRDPRAPWIDIVPRGRIDLLGYAQLELTFHQDVFTDILAWQPGSTEPAMRNLRQTPSVVWDWLRGQAKAGSRPEQAANWLYRLVSLMEGPCTDGTGLVHVMHRALVRPDAIQLEMTPTGRGASLPIEAVTGIDADRLEAFWANFETQCRRHLDLGFASAVPTTLIQRVGTRG